MILIFLALPFFGSSQNMRELLAMKSEEGFVDQIKAKDSLMYTSEDYFQLGMFEVECGKFKKALLHFEKAKKLGNESLNELELVYFKARCEAGMKNFAKSSLHFEKLLKAGVDPIIIGMTPESYLEVYRYYKPLIVTYGLNFGFWDYIFLIVSVLGFTLAFFFIFIFSKKNRYVIYMGFFILAFSINILEYVLYWSNYIVYSPVKALYLVLFFVYPPLLYLYIKNNIDVNNNHPVFVKKDHLHFLLFYGTLMLLVVYAIFPEMNQNSNFQIIAQILYSPWVKTLQVSLYLFLIIKMVQGKLHSLNVFLKRWVTLLLVFYILMAISFFLPTIFSQHSFFDKEVEYLFSIIYAVFVFMCAIMVVIQPEIFMGSSLIKSLKDKVKYQNSSLTESMTIELREKLNNLLEKEKVFMQSELNLIKLAEELDIDRYSMSQVINEGFGKGFYELINEYRINEAKKILSETDINIGDVIFEVGFNNHASFYKAFKKHTKTTPSEFIAMNRM